MSVYHDSSLVDMIHLPKCESLVAVTEPVELGSRGGICTPTIFVYQLTLFQDYANHITNSPSELQTFRRLCFAVTLFT